MKTLNEMFLCKYDSLVFDSWPNDLFWTNVDKTQSRWYLLLTILKRTNTTSIFSKWSTISPFSSLAIFSSVLPSNFIFSGVQGSGYSNLILNVILLTFQLVAYQSQLHRWWYTQNSLECMIWYKTRANLGAEKKIMSWI